jgi:hypothetical protein
MRVRQLNLRVQETIKRFGLAAFVFFLAKGLAWVVIGIGGYSSMTNISPP